MRTRLSSIAAAWAVASAGALAGGPIASEWPSYLGPGGNFSESSGAKLLEDMTKVRLVWESQETKIGFGKAHTGAGKSGVGRDFLGLPPGGEASPIVAGGLAIVSYFAPRGEVYDTEVAQRMGAAFEKHVWLVAADDVVIGIDAATGKTRWKTVFQDKGINTGAGKRGGWAATPCAAGGRVFALGTTGRVYCLDLATGKPLWESDIGPAHKALEAGKAKGLAEGRLALPLAKISRPYAMLVVIDGVLMAPDWRGGLVGIDPADGKTLWRLDNSRQPILSGYNAPCPVRASGKPYAACVNRTGDLRLIEPKTGRILWTVALKSEHNTQPVAGTDHLLVFESNPDHSGAEVGKSKEPNAVGVLAGYRFDENGATRDWALPGKYAHSLYLDGGPSRRVLARDGLVYYLCWGSLGDRRLRTLLIVREKDGQVLKEQDVGAAHVYLWGDRLITVSDLQHRPRSANAEIWQMYEADPAKFQALGGPWHVNDPQHRVHLATGGYEVPVYEAFADGRMFCRVMGGLRCYDLRRPAANGAHQ